MSNRIKVDTRRHSGFRKDAHGTITIEETLSPYDVPESLDGQYNQGEHRLVIRFNYIGGAEPTVDRQTKDGILKVGKHSGRLYAIELQIMPKSGPGTFVLHAIQKASDAIGSLAIAGRMARRGNYNVTKEILSEKGSDLLASAGS